MRVLHVVNYGWPAIDGYTVRTSGLIDAQNRHLGYETCVAVGPFAPFTAAADPKFRTGSWGPLQVPVGQAMTIERPGLGLAPHAHKTMVADLVELAEGFAPDVIHAHHPHVVGSAARDAARQLGLPFVYEIRCFNGDYDLDRRHPWFSRVRGPRLNALEYSLCADADAVVTISDGLARRLAENGVPGAHVIRNSVDVARFTPADTPASRSDATESVPDTRPRTFRVGYATSFEPIEALDGLVDALQQARQRMPADVRFEAVLAGTGRDLPAIRARQAELGAHDWLSLPGFVPYHQMPDLLREMDLFVVPRRDAVVAQDTTPLKPLEALACGIPVLSTDLPALTELLGGNPAVRFCAPTTAGLADGLLRAVTDPLPPSDPATLERSWRQEIPRYRAVYGALVDHEEPAA